MGRLCIHFDRYVRFSFGSDLRYIRVSNYWLVGTGSPNASIIDLVQEMGLLHRCHCLGHLHYRMSLHEGK